MLPSSTPLVEGSDEFKQPAATETVTVAVAEEVMAPPKDSVVQENDPHNQESLPTAKHTAVETKKKETFQRTLLEARIAYDQAARRSSTATTLLGAASPDTSTPSSFGRTAEIEKEPQKTIVNNVLATVFSMTEPEEIDQVVADDEEVPAESLLLMVDSSVQETEEEDVKVAEDTSRFDRVDPYQGMSLEDKAFAILSDLGMINGRE